MADLADEATQTILRTIIRDEVRPIVGEEVRLIIREEVRPIIREEVRPIIQEEVRPVIREETGPIVRKEVRPIIREETADLRSDVQTIKTVLGTHGMQLRALAGDVSSLKQSVRQQAQDVHTLNVLFEDLDNR